MSRHAVAYEGKYNNPLLYIERNALEPAAERIVVTLGFGVEPHNLIGRASDFQRDEETGTVSFEIYFYDSRYEELTKHASFAVAGKEVISSRVGEVQHVNHAMIIQVGMLLDGGLHSQEMQGL